MKQEKEKHSKVCASLGMQLEEAKPINRVP